jgi:hypothetical protein
MLKQKYLAIRIINNKKTEELLAWLVKKEYSQTPRRCNHPIYYRLERKVLSFGMKIGLSYVPYKDKLLGEQVAYVLDDMIKAIEKGRSTL